MAGGLTEILWISIYSHISSISALNIARQISVTILPFTADSFYAPMLGVFIHLILSVLLAIAFTATILKPAMLKYGSTGIMLSSFTILAIVWLINFLIVLPIINPSFTALMLVIITLAPKLLFGIAMGGVLVKNFSYDNFANE
jgi:hypothetical protein